MNKKIIGVLCRENDSPRSAKILIRCCCDPKDIDPWGEGMDGAASHGLVDESLLLETSLPILQAKNMRGEGV